MKDEGWYVQPRKTLKTRKGQKRVEEVAEFEQKVTKTTKCGAVETMCASGSCQGLSGEIVHLYCDERTLL